MSDDRPELERLVLADLSARLTPNGWKVELQGVLDSAFTIALSHELTTPYLVTFRNDTTFHLDLIEHVTSLPEIEVIAEAPAQLEHTNLLRSMRQAAQANRWSDGVLSIIARVLLANDVLTEDEATWLEFAGVPWSEDDRLDSAPSADDVGQSQSG